jgi:parallel beta-helix repeat protein
MMVALKMKQGFALALALVSVAAVSAADRADSAGGRPCLVANESSHRHYVSLQQGLDAAAAGDTLVVMGTCVGNFVIDKDLTLEGASNPGFGEPTLDGSGFSGSVLLVAALEPVRPRVAIDNLTITHGAADDIELGSIGVSVALTGTTVSDNGRFGIANGGVPASATLTDSTISGNAVGGLTASRGGFTLLRSSVTNNGGPGLSVGRASGASLTDSTVSGNGGAGIIVAGFVGSSSASLTDSTVTGNEGAGIRLATSESSASLSGSTVGDNHGSGIQLSGGGVSLTNSHVIGNSTSGNGGGINVVTGGFSLTDSTVSGNTAGGNGGGIYLASSSSSGTLTDSTVSGNTATSGGGIFNNGGSVTLSGTNTFLNNVPDDCVGVAGC